MIKQKYSKKGAMFGLDARIALVIVGTLSLVSSAIYSSSIYSTNYKKTSLETKTIAHALDRYHADMKASIFTTLNSSYTADEAEKNAFLALTDSQYLKPEYSTKWNGPYINSNYNMGEELYYDKFLRFVRLSNTVSTTCNNTAVNPCFIFLSFRELEQNKCNRMEKEFNTINYIKVHRQAATGTNCNIFIKLTKDY